MNASKVRKGEFAGKGALVQFIGLIFCLLFFPIGLCIGVVLLIAGGRMAFTLKCSSCMGRVEKEASVCPHCQASFKTTINELDI